MSSGPIERTIFDDDDDDEGWEDMPVVREDTDVSGMDEEDRKRYHYAPSAAAKSAVNARGNVLDVDDQGAEWRSKLDDGNENDYTRLRAMEEDEEDDVHLRTKYLFDEDKAMTPLSQMQATKNLLTEAQRIAYVGVCALTSREMSQALRLVKRKGMKSAIQDMELWAMKIMGRLYYHMELETQEQKMIESLAEHGVVAMDLVPSLMTTHTVANPEYDPAEARRQRENPPPPYVFDADEEENDAAPFTLTEKEEKPPPQAQSPSTPTPPTPTSATPQIASPTLSTPPHTPNTATQAKQFHTTAKVLSETSQPTIPGVSTTLSSTDERVTLDIRWTILCDLFLVLIADSVYDARSRVLLERVAEKLGLGWLDVVKFESRVTEALEIQESVERMESKEVIEGRQKSSRNKRYMMMGLATLGGGLVIGLSAGLLAPVIGAGLGAAFTTIGIGGTTGFLAGAGGAAVITTGGVLTGSGIAAKGMARRTRFVGTFDILPLHNNKRVSCILTVPGFMTGKNDDVRLPYSVLDPVVGDVFSVLWEPEMIQETGDALRILTTEVLTQLGQTVLQATVMTALMSALQWPIILTKLGYLIDNPWNNALDRARAAGSILADVLIQRHLGVRPITLIGFSLGARVIFYALLELARLKAYGVVQDVILLGATLSVSSNTWCDARSVVSGRFVNGFAKNDWVLNYLFRATSGGVGTVAGLRPIEGVAGLENVDVTDKIAGHMSYRAFMPLILDQLGYPVTADYFDEPEEPDFEGERVVVNEADEPKKKGWFGRKKPPTGPKKHVQPPPGPSGYNTPSRKDSSTTTPRTSMSASEDDLPDREEKPSPNGATSPDASHIPAKAGFDFGAIKEALEQTKTEKEEPTSIANVPPLPIHAPTHRSESAPPLTQDDDDEISESETSTFRSSFDTSAVPAPPLAVPELSNTPKGQDLPTLYSRSMSLQNTRSSYNSAEDSDIYQPRNGPRPSWPPPDEDAFASKPSFTAPQLTFGPSNGSLWTGTTNDRPSLGQSSFGTSLTSPSSSSAPGLSFGGMDGSITSPPDEILDPWALPKKSANSSKLNLDSNPWD